MKSKVHYSPYSNAHDKSLIVKCKHLANYPSNKRFGRKSGAEIGLLPGKVDAESGRNREDVPNIDVGSPDSTRENGQDREYRNEAGKRNEMQLQREGKKDYHLQEQKLEIEDRKTKRHRTII